MDHTTLSNLIAQIQSNLKTDYSLIKFHTEQLHKDKKDHHLDWSLAHMNISLMEFLRDLERHQKYLQKDINADQPIQDQLR